MTHPAGTPPPVASSTGAPSPASASSPAEASRAPRWTTFLALAAAVVVADQLAKAAVTSSLAPGQSVAVIGDLLRIVFGQNSGALFGLFKDNAAMFGIVSIAVIALIVAYHGRATPSLYLTVTLGLLLGGAIGNMIDRLRLGYVVDFVDAGLGSLRFYTFNVADSAISLSILLLVIAALRPSLVEGDASREVGSVRKPQRPPTNDADEDPWDDADDAAPDRTPS